MSRPKKQTVDYFPHDCNHKTTIYILEQKYGNNGYAFWFKLLELLGATEGHVYDCRKPHKWEFLQAKTRLSEDTCEEILNLLAKLEAIDPKLWSQKVIWSDNFILRIEDVYKNRRVEIPTRPSFYRQKPTQAGVSTDRNPQTKLKETKLKESKVKESIFSKRIDQVKKIEKILKKENKKYGLLKISSDKKWNKILELCFSRFRDGYTLLDICHAQRGLYYVYHSPETWWDRKKDLIEILMRGQAKTSKSWIWLDEFKDVYFKGIKDSRFLMENKYKVKESEWL